MASLSGSAASAAQTGNHRPIASDLLITSGCSTYHEWINAVRDEDKRTHDARTARKILGAQVSLWQFLATRHRAPAPGEKRKALPSDTRDIVYLFLGPVETGQRTLDGSDLYAVFRSTLADDAARAVAYYVDLAQAAARAGRGEVEITKEIFDAAPNAARGDVAVPIPLIADVLRAKQFMLADSRDRLHWEHGFDSTAFPMVIRFGTTAEAYYRSVNPVKTEMILERLNNRTGQQAAARVPSGSGADFFKRRENLPGGAAAVVKVIEEGLQAAVKWIEQKALDSFGRGDLEFVLTKEMWEQADLKLPNGKPVPFFEWELKRDFKTEGNRGHLSHKLCVLDCQALDKSMRAAGVIVDPAISLPHEIFPVAFKLQDFSM
eukprot:g788.t1